MASTKTLSRRELEQAIRSITHGVSSDRDDESAGQSDDEWIEDISDGEEDHESTASEASDTVTDIEMDTDRHTNESDSRNESNEMPESIFTAKNGLQWSSHPFASGKARKHNIVKGPMHKVILPPGAVLEEPVDAFNLLVDDSIVDNIVTYTNKEAQTVHEVNHYETPWKECDAVEIRALIGLLITAGHLKSNHQNCEVLWNETYGPPLFRATMGKNRFKSLLRYIRFDNKSTRSARRQKDKLAPIREIWDKVNENLRKHYLPGENITVDEQLVPFRGRCPFRQYLPSKPDKYGMKIWWVCDSTTFYPLNGIPYLGKESTTRATNLSRYVVETLVEPYERSNRNVTCDNYFTDLDLALSLLSKGLTLVGTVRKNKRFIPGEFLPGKDRLKESSVFGFTKSSTLVSYVPKPRKAVVLLSTMHHDSSVSIANARKPEIILYYNSTKGAVDSLDQQVHQYMCKRRTNRWPMAFFMNCLDVSGVAGFVLWKATYPNWNRARHNVRHLFLESVAESLILPQIRRRSVKGLHKDTLAVMALHTSSDLQSDAPPAKMPKKKNRCYLCTKDRKQRQCCDTCGKHVCNEHSVFRRQCCQCIRAE